MTMAFHDNSITTRLANCLRVTLELETLYPELRDQPITETVKTTLLNRPVEMFLPLLSIVISEHLTDEDQLDCAMGRIVTLTIHRAIDQEIARHEAMQHHPTNSCPTSTPAQKEIPA